MTRRRITLTLALSAVALLAGCATGYRNRLDAYRQNAPTSFDRQTLAWLDETGEVAAEKPVDAPLPALAESATTSTQEVALDVTARVTGLPAGRLSMRLEALDRPGAISALFEGEFGWEDMAVAVAAVNPEVRAARERWQAALRQFSQADHLEALVGQYRTFTRYLDAGAGKPLNKAMTQQFFPYPGATALKGELIGRQVELVRLDWEKSLREALVEAGLSFYTYQYLYRAGATSRDNVELVRDLLGVVEQQYRSGSTSQANLIKVQTELERQLNMLEDIQARSQSAAADLAALLDLPTDATPGKPDDRDLNPAAETLDNLTSQALATRQEVAIQQAKVDRADAAIRLGETMNRPLASRGASIFERGARPEAGTGESAASFGLMDKAQDRPAFAQAEAFLGEMRVKRQAEASMLAQARARTRAMARTWFQELDIARREKILIREIVLPQSHSAYETSRSAYAAGDISFLDLLDAERALIAARQQLDTARHDLNQTLIRQARVTGRLPGFP